jgi:isopentenyldiphosphate isomerase
MSENEILDQVNEQGEVIGQAPRSVFHSNPEMIHSVVHCWLFNREGEILWQQRSLQKTTSPGKWDMSCGGHILSGHTPDQTLSKELEEELGLREVDFKFVEKYIQKHQSQTELIYLYYAFLDKDITDMKLQKEEVERVEWIDPSIAQQKVIDGERESTNFVFTQITKILQSMSFSK